MPFFNFTSSTDQFDGLLVPQYLCLMTCAMPRINKGVLRRSLFDIQKKVLQMLMKSFAKRMNASKQPLLEVFFKGDEVLCLKLLWRWK